MEVSKLKPESKSKPINLRRIAAWLGKATGVALLPVTVVACNNNQVSAQHEAARQPAATSPTTDLPPTSTTSPTTTEAAPATTNPTTTTTTKASKPNRPAPSPTTTTPAQTSKASAVGNLCDALPASVVENTLQDSGYNFNNPVPCTSDPNEIGTMVANNYFGDGSYNYYGEGVWGPLSNDLIVVGVMPEVQDDLNLFNGNIIPSDSQVSGGVDGYQTIYNDLGHSLRVDMGNDTMLQVTAVVTENYSNAQAYELSIAQAIIQSGLIKTQ